MSTNHGEIEIQKPIGEYANYLKNLIPANMPEAYALKPMFKNVASEENIRNGVVAFRDFLYIFCDRLIADGQSYSKPQKTKNLTDYPFLNNVNQLLIEIGYHGKLTEDGNSLFVIAPKPRKPIPKQIESLRFLTLCGFVFKDIDLNAKTFNLSEAQPLEVLYPNDPILLTGLKALSIASKELWVRFYNNADNLLRCDYRVMKAEGTDVLDILKDVLQSLPEKLQKFALDLHERYTNMGMTCVTLYDNAIHFAYAYTKNSKRTLSLRDIYQQRIWEFTLCMKYGYCLVVRTKRTDKYVDDIEKFPLFLQKKIAQGYGCDRKRNERCQGGCQGIRLSLDSSLVDIKRDIEIWLDNEVPCSLTTR